MYSFISCLPLVIRAAGEAPEVVEAAARAAFNHSVGEALLDHAVPLHLEGQTLVVAVRDAVWQKQLTSVLGEVLFRINRLLGQSLVSFIELRIDEKVFSQRVTKQAAQADSSSAEVPLQLWSAANSISDKELRQLFLKAALSQSQRSE